MDEPPFALACGWRYPLLIIAKGGSFSTVSTLRLYSSTSIACGFLYERSGGSENQSRRNLEMARENISALRRLFFFCRRPADYFFMSKGEKSIVIIKLWSCISIIGFVQFIISNSFFTM